MTTFTYGTTSVTLEKPPIRPFATDTTLHQQTAIDSAGNRYVTDRTTVTTRPATLIFPRVTAAELADLRTFLYVTVGGNRHPFTWTDTESADHDVRLTAWQWTQTTPSHFRVTLTLEETL